MRSTTSRIALMPLLTGAALAGCVPRPPAGPAPESPEAMRHRAALATLLVRNATSLRLRIGYRLAAQAGGVVMVGQVAPRDSARTAPVPAGQPLLLRAVDPEGRTLVLPARTLEIGAVWTWDIPADAVFDPAGGGR